MINRYVSNPEHAPKITGMLIDLTVMPLDDILNMLQTPEILKQKVLEAEKLVSLPQPQA